MALQIRKACKAQKKLRLLISGQTASGKTYSSLLIAYGLKPDAKILVFDTESGRASLKSGQFNFDVIEWDEHLQGRSVCWSDYIEVIKIAENDGYDVLILDSVTPEWEEIKERHDLMSGNSFANWSKVKPDHNKFVNAILHSKIDIICTARSKMEYVLEETTNAQGRKVQSPTLKGLGTQQQNDLPYFMDFIFNIVDRQHNTEAEKDETDIYLNKGYFTITETVGQNIVAWLNDGEIVPPETKVSLNIETSNSNKANFATLEQRNELKAKIGSQEFAKLMSSNNNKIPLNIYSDLIEREAS